MILLSRTLFLIVFLILGHGQLEAGDGETESAGPFRWQVGEELFYKVKYSFLTVGELRFKVLDTDTIRNRRVYRCRMEIKSKNIPFLKIEDTYESYIDAEEIYSHRFWATERAGDHFLYTLYDFNYDEKSLRTVQKKYFEDDTLMVKDSLSALEVRVQDGLSLLFFARAHATISEKLDVDVYAFDELRGTFINFSGKQEEVKARGQEVDGWYLDGKMKFVGIAGIKEDFKGWFSGDAQKVPLHAKMKAIVGSVRLNLEEWSEWPEGAVLIQE